MSYREFIRLDRTERAGALILVPGRRNLVVERACDLGGEISADAQIDWQVILQAQGRERSASIQLDICHECLGMFPREVRRQLAAGGLAVPLDEEMAMAPAEAPR